MNEKEMEYIKRKEKYWNEKLEEIAKSMAEESGYSLTAPINWDKAKLFMIYQEICFDWRDLQQV